MMKKILLLSLVFVTALAYDRDAAVSYASKWWNTANHDCKAKYIDCSPWSYWGEESCGYPSHGGDCANFVSQCLLNGGHPALKKGECRGYPCGKEEVSANRLGTCLHESFGWKSTCGKDLKPPSDMKKGDVIVFHADSCSGYTAHATIVVSTDSGVKIACHSSDHYGADYTIFAGEKPYIQYLQYQG